MIAPFLQFVADHVLNANTPHPLFSLRFDVALRNHRKTQQWNKEYASAGAWAKLDTALVGNEYLGRLSEVAFVLPDDADPLKVKAVSRWLRVVLPKSRDKKLLRVGH